MIVKLYFSPVPVTDAKIRGRVAVVIDVLRASTSICTAVRNGCREVVPVGSTGDAAAMRANLDKGKVLLCGEREGLKVEGFDLGNSPSEYTEETVRDKVLIFASTNGSRAILKCAAAFQTLVCGFVNLSLVAETILNEQKDVAVVCAGRQGNFSLEDTFCGGALIDKLVNTGQFMVDNDAAQVAQMLYKNRDDSIEAVISRADHARYLKELGFGADILTAAAVDSVSVAPVLAGNKVIDLQKQKVEGTV